MDGQKALAARVTKVREAVGSILDDVGFERFLNTPQAGLSGRTPQFLLENDPGGLERVLDFVKGSKCGEMY